MNKEERKEIIISFVILIALALIVFLIFNFIPC